MSKYTVTTPPMSVDQAEEFGRWLGKYKVEIAGLEVFQVGASGHLYRDDPLMDTIITGIRNTTGSAVGSGIAAPVLAPIVGLIPPLGVLLMGLSLPALYAALFKLRKKAGAPDAAVAKRDPIIATWLKFGLAGVSAQRRKWSEYLIAIYAELHQWTEVRGFQHPEQIAVGAAYAARTGGYPRPWSEKGTAITKAQWLHHRRRWTARLFDDLRDRL